jgi:gamma-glutamylputrescine oxidase|tara:strand:- start:10278 stop:11537 length:1260 start_codon:yes stop_codon:yes gene_type:complete
MHSYYEATAKPRQVFPRLESHDSADICIIGAGYTGLSSALHLAKRGYKVVVLEAETVAFGASGRNGGHVGIGQRADQADLEDKLGHERASVLWDMGLEAVDTVKSLIAEHNIDCDLKYGNLHLAHKKRLCGELQEEVAFLADRYNFTDMEYIPSERLGEVVGSKGFYGGIWDKASCHLHPLNYALGLVDAAVQAGVAIYEHSRVTTYGGSPLVVKTSGGQITTSELILACNGYIENLEPKINGYIMPINNFVLATEPLSDELALSIIPKDTSMADSRFVINYWKLSADNRLIFGGGENYRRGFPNDIKNFVRKYMLQIYPQLANTKIDYGWGGTLAITLNRLPHFGRLQDNIWHMQGYSGHGVPTATFAGKLVAEAISGKLERFDVMADLPTHKFPGGTLLRWPGMVSAMLYYSLRDRF